MNTTAGATLLTEEEWRLVAELLDVECRRLPVEIRHTRTAAFREDLRRRLDTAEEILKRLRENLGPESAQP
jgi:hypothetical protein